MLVISLSFSFCISVITFTKPADVLIKFVVVTML